MKIGTWTATAVVMMSALTSGCTFIGLGVGLHKDHRNRLEIHAAYMAPDSIPETSNVRVELLDGTAVRGKYVGLRALPLEDYRRDYALGLDSLGAEIVLPMPGDTIYLVRSSGKRQLRLFEGFAPRAVLYRSANPIHRNQFALSKCPFTDIVEFQSSSAKAYTFERLQDLSNERKLPLRQTFNVRTQGTNTRIPLEQINVISTEPRYTQNWLWGMLIGMAVDGMVAYFVAESIQHANFVKM